MALEDRPRIYFSLNEKIQCLKKLKLFKLIVSDNLIRHCKSIPNGLKHIPDRLQQSLQSRCKHILN